MDTQKKILVIDDEEIVRELLTDVFSESGFQVMTAENGLAGLEHIRQPGSRYDLVIIDMSMPGMGGIEVCRELRKLKPDQKIMIATGNYSTDDELSEMKKNGVEHVLRKPFNFNEMIGLLRCVMNCQ
ncbi:MAG: response regulator [Nitrospirae bacterium]|nr:response regulator [Nitrospirota bacterium]